VISALPFVSRHEQKQTESEKHNMTVKDENSLKDIVECGLGFGLAPTYIVKLKKHTKSKQQIILRYMCQVLETENASSIRKVESSYFLKSSPNEQERRAINRAYKRVSLLSLHFNDGNFVEWLLVVMGGVRDHRLQATNQGYSEDFRYFLTKRKDSSGKERILRCTYNEDRGGFIYEKYEGTSWEEDSFIAFSLEDLTWLASTPLPQNLNITHREKFNSLVKTLKRVTAKTDFLLGRSDAVVVNESFTLTATGQCVLSKDTAVVSTIKAPNGTIANTETRALFLSPVLEGLSLAEAKSKGKAFNRTVLKEIDNYKHTKGYPKKGSLVGAHLAAFISKRDIIMSPVSGPVPDGAKFLGLSDKASNAACKRVNWISLNMPAFADEFFALVINLMAAKIGEQDILQSSVQFSDTGVLIDGPDHEVPLYEMWYALVNYAMNGMKGATQCDQIIFPGRDSDGVVQCLQVLNREDMMNNPAKYEEMLETAVQLDTPSEQNGGIIAGIMEINGSFYYALSIAIQLRLNPSKLKSFFTKLDTQKDIAPSSQLTIDIAPNVASFNRSSGYHLTVAKPVLSRNKRFVAHRSKASCVRNGGRRRVAL
jgi:hypothetical protein